MRKCVIMGNGPSLNKININDLKGVDTFSFNRAYLAYDEWDFCPTYYGFIDRDRISLCYDEIKEMLKKRPGIKMVLLPGAPGPGKLPAEKVFSEEKRAVFVIHDNVQWIADPNMFGAYTIDNMPRKFDPCPFCMGSVCVSAIQFLYALGYTHVGMVGVDARYVQDKHLKREERTSNHFRDDYIPGDTCSNHDIGNDLHKWRAVSTHLKRINKMWEQEVAGSDPAAPTILSLPRSPPLLLLPHPDLLSRRGHESRPSFARCKQRHQSGNRRRGPFRDPRRSPGLYRAAGPRRRLYRSRGCPI